MSTDVEPPPAPTIQPRVIKYSVHRFSSFSSNYVPENILIDRPKDQSSRWSSDTTDAPQFLILKMEKLAVVETITFGKFEKSHVCNLKRFKIYGGMEDDANFAELLEGGLRNDGESETFLLKHSVEGKPFPCRYLKIAPLTPFGSSFNFSIWFVELRGADSWEVVQPALRWLREYREKEAIRLCLKHFRQNNYGEAFETLQKKTRVSLEHPALTELHKLLVEQGDYEATERTVRRHCDEGLFDAFLEVQECAPAWTLINPPTEDVNEPRPGMRGGHQMCIDVATETIYLFGGWDGSQDLADFWRFHVPTQRWTLISSNTALDGGPCPRSCHKIALDGERRQIFALGRYVDSSMRTRSNLKSDFYLYDIEANRWTLITDDTSAMGGPKLIFDHQMAMDVSERVLYVFGGRVLTPIEGLSSSSSSLTLPMTPPGNPAAPTLAELVAPSPSSVASSCNRSGGGSRPEYLFSGLYSYHVSTNTWTLLREDAGACVAATSSLDESGGEGQLRSRIGHSMLFHPIKRKLFIFAGQRSKEYLDDFLTYDVDADRVEIITGEDPSCSPTPPSPLYAETDLRLKSSFSSPLEGLQAGVTQRPALLPAAGFTQRATLDPDLDEIHVLSGLSKDKDKREENVKNSFWVYSIPNNRWRCVYKNENLSTHYFDKMLDREPCPRFAHQLVFDHLRKVHYLFGGNPGKASLPRMRLDDFWALRLVRPRKEEALRRCVFSIRKYEFLEMTTTAPMDATEFLQTRVSAVVDHGNEEEKRQFHLLASRIFAGVNEDKTADPPVECDVVNDGGDNWKRRTELFDHLVAFYPDNMTQPKQNLVDLVSL